MTELLEGAIAEMHKLPPDSQDAIAAIVLEELADEQAWADVFARSRRELAEEAARVRDEIRTGRTRDGGWDAL